MRPARGKVEFVSEGTTLRGWLFVSAVGGRPAPAVAMLHGFSATATGMVADRYAEGFATAGVTSLVFDTRGIGFSDGEPRQAINAWTQARDYRAAIDFLAARPDVDEHRIGIWGDSLSGSVALVVAAVDPRVAAVVVQVPACGDGIADPDPSGTRFAGIRDTLLAGDLSRRNARVDGPRPVVSLDQLNSPSLLRPHTAYHWFLHYGARYGTGWQNLATRVELDAPTPFDPQPCAAHIDAPVQMIVAEHDEMPGADSEVALHTFASVPGPKELVRTSGGHFGLLYHDSTEFQIARDAQQSFLTRHLIAR